MTESSRKILLVDGSHTFIKHVSQLLIPHYEIITALSTDEGLGLALEQLPDLIICGIELRDGSGHHFLMALRDDPRVAHIPFILIGNKDTKEDQRMAMNLGADDYLVQPLKRQDLLSSIRARLSRFAIFNNMRRAIETKQETGAGMPIPLVPADLQDKLSKTEARIIRLIAEGKNTKEIAQELYVSIKTVENHKYNIAQKLGLTGRNSLTEYVIKNIIQPYKRS
jgi:DNA-binding NarL/FixJ family response regulator